MEQKSSKRIRKLIQVDVETGEVIERGALVSFPNRTINGYLRWMAMNQDVLFNVANTNNGLNGEDYRTLFAMLGCLEFDNFILVNQTELAKKIGMLRPNLARSIKKLVKEGILIKGARLGPCRSYKLDPMFGWKGSAKNHLKAIKGGKE